MKYHESILIFYKKQPTYNPQKVLRDEKNKRNNKPRKFNSAVNNGWDNNSEEALKMNQGTSDYIHPNSVNKWNMQRGLHPTQKPVSMFEYLLKTYSNENMTIFDPCMGSGTTGIACKNLNRSFIGIEKDENYFKIAEQRINSIQTNQK
jgi:site-specific DNA-methyltransferase (adenine-specific)